MIYVYAIAKIPGGRGSRRAEACPRDAARQTSVSSVELGPRPPGLENRPVESLQIGQLAVYTSLHESTPPPAAANVLRHETIIEALMSSLDVLPARFGTIFRRVDFLNETIERNHDRLLAGLANVAGCVELGVRVMWNPPPIAQHDDDDDDDGGGGATPATGRAYMLRRAATERRDAEVRTRAKGLADLLHAPLLQFARASTRRILAAPGLPLSAAYLVPRNQVEPFRHAIANLAGNRSGLRLLCTGPWPPYHFTPALEVAEVCHA